MTTNLATYKSTRVRGLAKWRPQRKTLALLRDIGEVLDEYNEHLPLTARQLFYRLVGTRNYAKTENAYSRLTETLNRARRAGMVAWEAIRDDGAIVVPGGGYYGMAGFWGAVVNTAKTYRTKRLSGQTNVLELWCEAGGMVPQLARVARPYGVTVHSSGGFDSTTVKHEAARRYAQSDRQTVILHVGDHDASGLSVFDSAAEDVAAMVSDLGVPGCVTFIRVAVTPEQILRYALPGAPAKKTDRRGNWEGDTVQAEALDPGTLAAEVRSAIEAHLDIEIWRELIAEEEVERWELVERVEELMEGMADVGGE